MKRRRQRLTPQTFPFLAVLLCAMGSLLLLLLVIDRRAKAVARAKALEAYAQAADARKKAAPPAPKAEPESDAQAAARCQEWEARRRDLHALLAEQERELRGRIEVVRAQTAAVAERARAGKDRQAELERRLRAEEAQFLVEEKDLAARRAEVRKAAGVKEAAEKEAAKLAEELAGMERALRDLKELRQRDRETYSVVPYLGKRGGDRKPLYVECAARQVVFHPDRLTLVSPTLTPAEVRKELERRVGIRPAAGEKETPYLLLLVRPDGVETYYLMQASLAGMDLEYGYELIEQDWALDFATPPELAKGPLPWRNVTGVPAPGQLASLPREGTGGPRRQGVVYGPAGKAGGTPPPGVAALGTPQPTWTPASGAPGPGKGPGKQAAPGKPGGPAPGPAGQHGGPALPPAPPDGERTGTGEGGPKVPGTPGLSPIGPLAASALPPLPPAAKGKRQAGDGTGDQEPGAPGSPGGGGRPRPLAERKTPPPLSRLTGSRDWFIILECKAAAVTVHSIGESFAPARLAGERGAANPLTEGVRHLVARRQAAVRPGEPPYRPVLKFRVHPDGLRTYYLAYGLLEPLGLAMARENVVVEPPLFDDPFRR